MIDGKKYDRLPVLVTGLGVEQLLGVPRLSHGTGELEAEATFQLLKCWGVESKTVGKVYDTTSVNSGWINGASTLLQKKLKKEDMLDIGCRHHIFELVMGAAFTSLLGESKSPKLPVFEKLTNAWPDLDKGMYTIHSLYTCSL